MKKFILIAAATVAMASSMQVASAAERNGRSTAERTAVQQPSQRTRDAYASYPVPAPQPEPYVGYAPYSGGYSAPAGR